MSRYETIDRLFCEISTGGGVSSGEKQVSEEKNRGKALCKGKCSQLKRSWLCTVKRGYRDLG